MKNYFGRLVSARSGRGVLRPPRMLFGSAPRVAVAAPVVSVAPRTALTASAPLARPLSSAVAGVETTVKPKEKAVPPATAPAVVRGEVSKQATVPVRTEVPPSRTAVRPVLEAPASGPSKDVEGQPALKPVRTAVEPQEGWKVTEQAAAHPPSPMPANPVPPLNAARSTPDVPLWLTPVQKEAQTEAVRMPVAQPAAEQPPRADPSAKAQNASLRPVVAPPLLPPSAALRSLAEPPRQESPKIEIGTIEVRITQPQRRATVQSARAAEAPARAGTLARGFFHSFGMRQG